MPEVSLWDMISSKSFRSGNLPKFVAKTARELGPVFRLKVPRRNMVVLAGIEANRWVAKKGRFHLRTRDYLEDFQAEWGTARSIASMERGRSLSHPQGRSGWQFRCGRQGSAG